MQRHRICLALLPSIALSGILAGCAAHNPRTFSAPQQQKPSEAGLKLANLPLPGQRVAVAVYNFSDQTGQFKPTDNVQTLSRAVTQGATSILIEALHQAADRKWFTVIERERLDNVLRERAVIREMRSSYLGEKTVNPQALPPLLFAGILLEGGIIGYDANTKTGGLGARFLGIGGHVKYREDTVTIYLRAVSVKTGEVLSTVSVRKSIASVAAGADTFRYVAFKNLLEIEGGFSYNEPDQLALRHAIEEAVYSLVLEGSTAGLWCLDTQPEIAEQMVRNYLAERQSVDHDVVKMPVNADGRLASLACGKASSTLRAPKTLVPKSADQPAQTQQSTSGKPVAGIMPTPSLRHASEGAFQAASTIEPIIKFISRAVVQPIGNQTAIRPVPIAASQALPMPEFGHVKHDAAQLLAFGPAEPTSDAAAVAQVPIPISQVSEAREPISASVVSARSVLAGLAAMP